MTLLLSQETYSNLLTVINDGDGLPLSLIATQCNISEKEAQSMLEAALKNGAIRAALGSNPNYAGQMRYYPSAKASSKKRVTQPRDQSYTPKKKPVQKMEADKTVGASALNLEIEVLKTIDIRALTCLTALKNISKITTSSIAVRPIVLSLLGQLSNASAVYKGFAILESLFLVNILRGPKQGCTDQSLVTVDVLNSIFTSRVLNGAEQLHALIENTGVLDKTLLKGSLIKERSIYERSFEDFSKKIKVCPENSFKVSSELLSEVVDAKSVSTYSGALAPPGRLNAQEYLRELEIDGINYNTASSWYVDLKTMKVFDFKFDIKFADSSVFTFEEYSFVGNALLEYIEMNGANLFYNRHLFNGLSVSV